MDKKLHTSKQAMDQRINKEGKWKVFKLCENEIQHVKTCGMLLKQQSKQVCSIKYL